MDARIAASTSICRYYPLELALEEISKEGFDGVEIWGGAFHGYYLDALKKGATVYDRILDSKKLDDLKSKIRSSGLELTCYNPEQCIYPMNYLATDIEPFDGQAAAAFALGCFYLGIDIASFLGCGRILVTTPAWFFKKSRQGYVTISHEESLDRAMEMLVKIAKYAAEKSVRVQLEPLSRLETNAITTLEDVRHALKVLPEDSVDLLIDIGHENVTARDLGLSLEDYLDSYFQEFGSMIKYIHVDDNDGSLDSHLTPGEGNVDFERVFGILRRNNFSGWLTAELSMFGQYGIPPYPVRALHKAREVMSRLRG